MNNSYDRNKEDVEREDRIEANTLRYLIKNENKKLLNVSLEEEVQSLKKICTWYSRLEQVLEQEEKLREEEKQNLEFIERRIEEISRPIKEEIDALLDEFDNISDKERAAEILIQLKQKYKELEIKGFLNSEDRNTFDFVKKSLEKIELKKIEKENKERDTSWEEYKEEIDTLEDDLSER